MPEKLFYLCIGLGYLRIRFFCKLQCSNKYLYLTRTRQHDRQEEEGTGQAKLEARKENDLCEKCVSIISLKYYFG